MIFFIDKTKHEDVVKAAEAFLDAPWDRDLEVLLPMLDNRDDAVLLEKHFSNRIDSLMEQPEKPALDELAKLMENKGVDLALLGRLIQKKTEYFMDHPWTDALKELVLLLKKSGRQDLLNALLSAHGPKSVKRKDDCFYCGTWEGEHILWRVLEISDNNAMVISEYGLEARCYHPQTPYPTWEKSDIRAWLNGEFLNAAFTAEEQKGIVTTKISTPSYNGNSGGADTQDKIWLLSIDEATTYFKSNDARKTTATAYANANGAYKGSDGCCWWWLRSPAYFTNDASLVNLDGSLYSISVKYTSSVARPAFILNLDSAAIY